MTEYPVSVAKGGHRAQVGVPAGRRGPGCGPPGGRGRGRRRVRWPCRPRGTAAPAHRPAGPSASSRPPNASRSTRWTRLRSRALRAPPSEQAAMPGLPPLRPFMAIRQPSPSAPSSQSAANRTPSRTTWRVGSPTDRASRRRAADHDGGKGHGTLRTQGSPTHGLAGAAHGCRSAPDCHGRTRRVDAVPKTRAAAAAPPRPVNAGARPAGAYPQLGQAVPFESAHTRSHDRKIAARGLPTSAALTAAS